ncbi:hypothetical protein PJU73_03880 [Neisseria lisongii]|uniref:Uncharacterized protein n=1 Tax=Neisseria lisongii TaxID=2912188 RepID=A0ABY7RKV0_9NEIS|nr:hypothetical protein [Neisseria lisongii]WCL72254.1 hypothetical protein PJU73_03880 [Neisseria lisongii]
MMPRNRALPPERFVFQTAAYKYDVGNYTVSCRLKTGFFTQKPKNFAGQAAADSNKLLQRAYPAKFRRPIPPEGLRPNPKTDFQTALLSIFKCNIS